MRYTAEVALSPMTYRFTVKDYHRMAEADIFEPDDRVELVDGEVVAMSPYRYAPCRVRHASRIFLGRSATSIVSVQCPIQVGEFSEPQPDLAILRP